MPYDIRKNEEKLANLQQQHKNGQTRGDLLAPDVNDIRHNYNTYRYDYFSGAQAKVFFGDVLVDDIVTLSYAMRQTKEPIYGYASQRYDAVAMGTVIGEGSLTIAFKEVGYLNVIQSYLENQREGIDLAKDNVIRRLTSGRERNISQEIQNTSTLSAVMAPNLTPSLVRRSENIEKILDDLKEKDISPFKVRGREDGTITTGAQDFDDMAELLEDTIWGDHNGKPFDLKDVELKRADEFDYRYGRSGKIGIKAGNRNNYRDTLNIMVIFGDINDFKAEHTFVLLNDVHFNSHSMVMGPTGDPIGETYNFFFHDMNKSLSTQTFNVNGIKLNVGTKNEDITLPRKEDMEYLNDFIGRPEQFFKINVVSAFRGGVWTNDIPLFFEDKASKNNQVGFTRRDDIPYVPQLTKFVEQTVTEKALGQTDLPEKLLVKIEAESNDIQGTETMHFILDKGSDFSSLYVVTVPTKNDFYAVNLVQREDFFFNPAPPEPILEPIQSPDLNSETTVTDPKTGEVFTSAGSQEDIDTGPNVSTFADTGKVDNTDPVSPLDKTQQDIINEQQQLLDQQVQTLNQQVKSEGLTQAEYDARIKALQISNQALLQSQVNALEADKKLIQDLGSTPESRGQLLGDRTAKEKASFEAIYGPGSYETSLQKRNKEIIESQTRGNNPDPSDVQQILPDSYQLEGISNKQEYNGTYSETPGTDAPGFVPRTSPIDKHLPQLDKVREDYGEIADRTAQNYPDIDKETLLAIIYQESKGFRYARPQDPRTGKFLSSSRGVGQFKEGTGKDVGFEKRPSNYRKGTTEWDREVYADWYDPNKAIPAIATYLQRNGDKKWLEDLKYSNPKAYQQVRNSFHHSGPYGKLQRQGQINTADPNTVNWLSNVEAWKEYYKQSSQ